MRHLLKIIILFFVGVNCCFAFEWKNLHEEADKKNLTQAQEAVTQKPDSIEDLYILALVDLNLHKDAEAEANFKKILELKPDLQEASWGVAEVLRRKHNYRESQAILKNLIASRPDFSPAYITLAYMEYANMKFNESIRLAVKVLAQDEKEVDLSNRVRAYLLYSGNKGMIAHYGGPLSKIINGTAVLSNIKKAESLQPNSPGVLFGLGTFYLLAPSFTGGDIDKAGEYLKKAVAADPLFADTYVRLAQYYQIKKDKEKFKLYLDKALEIDPQSELAVDIKSRTCKFICAE